MLKSISGIQLRFCNAWASSLSPIFVLGAPLLSPPRSSSATLLAGMNGKHLKLYDLRANNPEKGAIATFTRAVSGVCVDPFMQSRVASMMDNSVVLWDTRSGGKKKRPLILCQLII